MNRWWLDFGGSFATVLRRIRWFILVVWAGSPPKKGSIDTRKAPPTLFTTDSSGTSHRVLLR